MKWSSQIKGSFLKVTDSLYKTFLGTVTRVKTNRPLIALTFDDGPHPEYTPRLLDILDRHHAKATFFIVGNSAKKYPRIVDDMLAGEHELGCHSWRHVSFPTLSRAERVDEIHKCETLLNGRLTKLFRPPYGHIDLLSHMDIRRMGYTLIAWNVSANDWLDYDANWICQKLNRKAKPGNIVLLHDALYTYTDQRYQDRSPTIEAVDRFLKVQHENYRFVTVSELMNAGEIKFEKWVSLPDREWLNDLSTYQDPNT